MGKTILKTEQDVRDFVRGCTFMGTGGGGLEENGVESLLSELRQGKEISWIDVNDVPDDAVTACPFLMGTIAPHTPELIQEMEGLGMNAETSVYPEKERTANSIRELEEYTGKKIEIVVPLELGGASSPACVGAGIACGGIPAVDGDYTGRAIPEIPQTTPYLYGKKMWPLACCDEFGNVSIIKNALNYRVVERLGKKISEGCFGLDGDTGFLMSGKEMKEVINRGTLSKCYRIGRMIREANEKGGDPVATVAKEMDAYILIRGKLVKKETEDKEGYYWGFHTVEGTGEYAGHQVKVWFKNENHIAWKDEQPVVTSPDIIVVIDDKTGMPCTNPKLEEGMDVAVLGMKGVEAFRSEKGLGILSAKYFGWDIPYVPIEDTLG